MKKAEKALEKINSILDKTIDGLKQEFIETDRSYRDTGYERHYKKMEKLQEDIDTLEDFRNSKSRLAEAKRECERERKIRAVFERKLNDFERDYPGDEYVREIVRRCKEKLKSAEIEADRS